MSLLHKNGQSVVAHLTLIPIRSKGEVSGICGFAKDVQLNRMDPTIAVDKNNIDHAQQVGHFGIWEFDVHHNEYKCSPNMCSIFGWNDTYEFKTTSEFILGCVHIEDRDKVESNYNLAINHGTPYEQEYRIYTNRGERYMLSQGNPVKDEKGKVVRLIGTVHDRTEHKQAEKEKFEMEQLYNSLFTYNSDATYLLDDQGNYLDLNHASEELHGYSKQEILKQNFAPLIHPKDLQQVSETFREVLNGSTKTLEFTLLHKDGREVTVYSIAVPVIVETNNVVGIIVISKDITEQRRLEESEQRYCSLYLYTAASLDLNGNYIDCNPALEQLLG
jgi:PAS domain S-box-containing protein